MHVRLSGDIYDLEDLSKVCNSEELTIERDEDSFVLKSTEFNNLKGEMEVYKKATEIVALVNGASVVVMGLRNFLRASRSLIKIDDEGRKNSFFIAEPAKAAAFVRGSFQTTLKKADGGTEVIYQASPVPRLVRIAKDNEKVAKVIRLLSIANYEWTSNFYRIFEIIKSDVCNAFKRGWVTNTDVKRFTGTVNNPDIIGDIARHGKSKKSSKGNAMKNPMNFWEAKAFIDTIILKWLSEKL